MLGLIVGLIVWSFWGLPLGLLAWLLINLSLVGKN